MPLACNHASQIAGANEYRRFGRRELLAIQAYLCSRNVGPPNDARTIMALDLWVPTMDPELGARILTKWAWKAAQTVSAFTLDPNAQWAECQTRGFARLSTEELNWIVGASFCANGVPST
jgi:hypothetical protein